MLSIAKNNGISTKEALTTEETIEYCKKGSWNVGANLFMGLQNALQKQILLLRFMKWMGTLY